MYHLCNESFSPQMAKPLWKSRPEFIPSIVVYSIAFVVSLPITFLSDENDNMSNTLKQQYHNHREAILISVLIKDENVHLQIVYSARTSEAFDLLGPVRHSLPVLAALHHRVQIFRLIAMI